MDRIIKAFFNSLAGWRHAVRTEAAVREELIVLILALPTVFFLTDSAWKRLALIGVLVFVLIVEFLNTAIEKLCDHVRPEIHPQIKVVKDLGSTAVFLSIALALAAWLLARRMGLPVTPTVIMLLAAPLPFMTFIVERWVTRKFINPALAGAIILPGGHEIDSVPGGLHVIGHLLQERPRRRRIGRRIQDTRRRREMEARLR